ncbi:hypothetical protein QBC44DRAFT_310915 [Cladorrhinum sp. PSN332]|nr:hypothetical protein QBC44DRAFT_310915 [Cladorrhinum sp. PSN332]
MLSCIVFHNAWAASTLQLLVQRRWCNHCEILEKTSKTNLTASQPRMYNTRNREEDTQEDFVERLADSSQVGDRINATSVGKRKPSSLEAQEQNRTTKHTRLEVFGSSIPSGSVRQSTTGMSAADKTASIAQDTPDRNDISPPRPARSSHVASVVPELPNRNRALADPASGSDDLEDMSIQDAGEVEDEDNEPVGGEQHNVLKTQDARSILTIQGEHPAVHSTESKDTEEEEEEGVNNGEQYREKQQQQQQQDEGDGGGKEDEEDKKKSKTAQKPSTTFQEGLSVLGQYEEEDGEVEEGEAGSGSPKFQLPRCHWHLTRLRASRNEISKGRQDGTPTVPQIAVTSPEGEDFEVSDLRWYADEGEGDEDEDEDQVIWD